MLCRKPGIHKIQLTKSMRKVGPSITAPASADWACVVVVRQHPSSDNIQLSKHFQGFSPSQSFEQKKLTNMVLRLWSCLGVPERNIENYKRLKFTQHCWVPGLADPTSLLPAGMYIIFVLPYIYIV